MRGDKMINLYSLPGCPMCDMLAGKLAASGVEYIKITDMDVMKSIGITHVPMLQIDDGDLMGLADALKYIKGVTA